jgi:hypothetical protein
MHVMLIHVDVKRDGQRFSLYLPMTELIDWAEVSIVGHNNRGSIHQIIVQHDKALILSQNENHKRQKFGYISWLCLDTEELLTSDLPGQ